MRKFLKDELFFLCLTLFQWICCIYVPFLIIKTFSVFNLEMLFLVLFTLLFFVTFRYVHKKYKQVGNQYYFFTLIVLVGCISLGAFSMAEFRSLGFDFAEDQQRAIGEYFWLKTFFNFIGLSCLPSLLERYFELKKSQVKNTSSHKLSQPKPQSAQTKPQPTIYKKPEPVFIGERVDIPKKK